jgi:hypothetical protein
MSNNYMMIVVLYSSVVVALLLSLCLQQVLSARTHNVAKPASTMWDNFEYPTDIDVSSYLFDRSYAASKTGRSPLSIL